MADYTTKVWSDGTSGGTPLSAAALNDLESRIDTGFSSLAGGPGSGTVTAVNAVAPDGTGNVELVAGDVGARADDWAPTVADLPGGVTLSVYKTAGTWPARPTARADITVHWHGADPPPSIVSSGTGGMRDNVDLHFVTP